MARDPVDDDDFSSDELEMALEETEPIQDELLTSTADVPIVEPQPVREPPSPVTDARRLTRALWFFAVIVTALVVLQTVHLFLPRSGPVVAASHAPDAASHGGPNALIGEASLHESPASEVDRKLAELRTRLMRGSYLDVIRVLKPLAENAALLEPEQRWEAYVLLARAYRHTGNEEQAQIWQLRATDQYVERREPAQVVEHASLLASEGRNAEARLELMKLLARRDGFGKKEEPWLARAEARIADAWYAGAKQSGHLAPLPGASREDDAESRR